MRKFLLLMCVGLTLLFGDIDLSSATKKQLMDIKGIGSKKADLIIQFREGKETISPSDLKQLKGFGPVLIKNIEEAIKK